MSAASTDEPLGYRARRRCTGSRAALWQLVSDPEAWPGWNASVARLDLDGPFGSATSGRLTTRDGQELPFALVEVIEQTSYSSITRIASTVSLESALQLVEDGERGELYVEQASRLTGPAAEHFAPSFGAALIAGVEQTVTRLAAVDS